MHPKDAEGIANSVDPDQTAPWSGSALFAQAWLSKNLGTLRYGFLLYMNCNKIFEEKKKEWCYDFSSYVWGKLHLEW